MIQEFFEFAALIFSFPWPNFVLGAFGFAMLFRFLIWVLFNRKWVKT